MTDAGILEAHNRGKSHYLAKVIRKKIDSGALPVGSRLPRIQVLANEYGMHHNTVASALSRLRDEGMLSRIPRRGTEVIATTADCLAKEKADCKSDSSQSQSQINNAVGIIVPSINPLSEIIIPSLSQHLLERGLYPMFIDERCLCREDKKGVRDQNAIRQSITSFLKNLAKDQVNCYGLLMQGLHPSMPYGFIEENIEHFHNLVFFFYYCHPTRIKPARYVLVDYAEAGRVAARYLIDKGHKKIGFLPHFEPHYAGPWSSNQVQMMHGIAEVCYLSGIEFVDKYFWEVLHGADLTGVCDEMLSSPDYPTSLFGYSDSNVVGNLAPQIKRCGMTPGHDVELVGFCDMLKNSLPYVPVGFSTFRLDTEEMTRQCLDMLSGESNEEEVMVVPEFIPG